MLKLLNNTRKRSRLYSLGTSFLGLLVLASTLFLFDHPRWSSQAATSFSFTAAGDYGQSNYTTANLTYMGSSGVSFNLALGDFSYDPNVSADSWSSYAKSILPANFPFEIVPGDHDTSQINTYAIDLPDHIGKVLGSYGTEYAFDYPPRAPLARFIMLSPGVVSTSNYSVGGGDYIWVSNTIDSARSAKIRWVIVGMAEGCLFVSGPATKWPCGQPDLLNLLVSKKVDLILQAHVHNYQASKQLALNSKTCPTISLTSYNAQCVVKATTSLTRGAGTVIVNTGTGGQALVAVDPTDPKAGYFRKLMRPYVNPSFGVSQFTLSATKISMKFVAALGGTFTDSFAIA